MKRLVIIMGAAAALTGVITVVMALMGQKLVVGPFALVTVMLGFLGTGVWYLDHRIRFMLISLADQLMSLAFEEDKPLVYNSSWNIKDDLQAGLGLVEASLRLGQLSSQLDGEIDNVEL